MKQPSLPAALAYCDGGLAVIPVPFKKKSANLVKWTPYQTTAPTRDQVWAWLNQWPGCNWAVILGPVSGNLIAVDFDDQQGYARWAAGWPDLAQIAPTVATVRGKHVYFRGPPDMRTAKLDGYAGELKGAGGLAMLPPSVHPSGAVYRWLHGDVTRFVPEFRQLHEIGIVTYTPPTTTTTAGKGAAFTPRRPTMLKPCAGAILTATTAAGGRNDTAWRLALHLRSDGWSEASAGDLMGAWAERSGMAERELQGTIKSAYRAERTPGHGCGSRELAPFCDSACPLARFVGSGMVRQAGAK